MFNIRLFQEQLKVDLTAFETKFLVRTFSYASAIFLSFGLFFLALWNGVGSKINPTWASLFWLISVGLFVFFYFCYKKYSEFPMDVDKTSVVKTYSVLFLGYTFLFLALFHFFHTTLGFSIVQHTDFLVILIFILASIVYAIPAIIASVLIKQKISLSLNQFLKYCCFLYAIILLVFLIISWSLRIDSLPNHLLIWLIGISVVCAPLLSFYRLKMTSRYIDYTNPIAIYKWELFFILQMTLQLLLMPIYITKFALMFLEHKHKR